MTIGVFVSFSMAHNNKLDHERSNIYKFLDKYKITGRSFNFDKHFSSNKIIVIKNQKEFDNLTNLISKTVKSSNDIIIEIKAGTYFSNTNHIYIEKFIYPNCNLIIRGNGNVTIMATSEDLSVKAKKINGYKVVDVNSKLHISPEDIFTDGEDIISWSINNYETEAGVSFVQNLFTKIEPSNKSNLSYKLKSNLLPNLTSEECKNLWLWATHSWISTYEKIDSVVGGYIFLTANKETELYQCPLNTDYKSWGIMPRIKIVNYSPSKNGVYFNSHGKLYLPENAKSIYKCDKGSFLRIKDSNIKTVDIFGIKFVGGKAPIIDVDNMKGSIYVHDCEFVSQQDLSIRMNTDNSFISNNTFRNSMKSVIEIPNNGHKNHFIIQNNFSNCGHRLLNHGCIKAAADSVLIADNVFRNNLIAAINIGVWHGATPKGKIFSIVEDNIIYNDKDFLKEYKNNSLLDVSLLYVYTKNDNAIIRRNRIHGLKTLASGNGIYIDDGAYNVKVYDNIITGIDGKLYNINCRKNISEIAKSNAPEYSTNNFIGNNILDGPIRFEVRTDINADSYPKSVYGDNVFIYTNNTYLKNFKNRFENILSHQDLKIKTKKIDLTIGISIDDYNFINDTTRYEYSDFVSKWLYSK